MSVPSKISLAAFLLLVFSSGSADDDDSNRTGFFRLSVTPLELLGEQGAAALSEVFAADEELRWQLDVPNSYEATDPPGLIVFVNRASWGGGRKAWSDVLREKNLIWVGAIDAGDQVPMNERMLKAILAPTFVASHYSLNPERIYIAGYVGGAQLANMLSTAKPELFKGGLFLSGGVFWGDKEPPKIDAVRQNRYVFMAGANDVSRTKVARVAAAYKDAGATNTELIIVPNTRQKLPGASYFSAALDYLDSRN